MPTFDDMWKGMSRGAFSGLQRIAGEISKEVTSINSMRPARPGESVWRADNDHGPIRVLHPDHYNLQYWRDKGFDIEPGRLKRSLTYSPGGQVDENGIMKIDVGDSGAYLEFGSTTDEVYHEFHKKWYIRGFLSKALYQTHGKGTFPTILAEEIQKSLNEASR